MNLLRIFNLRKLRKKVKIVFGVAGRGKGQERVGFVDVGGRARKRRESWVC
jgi:hypothetical protein